MKNYIKITLGILGFVILFIGQNVFAVSLDQVSDSTPPVYACSITSFTVNNSSISANIISGGSAMLSWSTENCSSVDISSVGTNLPITGTTTIYPSKTTTYTLTGNSLVGAKPTKQVVVNMTDSTAYACSITSFTINDSTVPTSIILGDSAAISWESENCSSVDIPGVGTNLPGSGVRAIYPSKTTTYTITGNSTTGTKPTRQIQVIVTDPTAYACSITNFTINDSISSVNVTSGDSAVVSWSTVNCNSVDILGAGTNLPASGSRTIYPTQTSTYTITGNSTTGTKPTRQIQLKITDPTEYSCEIINFEASDTSVDNGDYTTLRWDTENCDQIKISGVGSNLSVDGSRKVYPDKDTTYVLTANGNDGSSQTDSILISVNQNNIDNNNNDCTIDKFTASDTSIQSGDPVTLRWNTTDCDSANISNIGNVSLDGSQTIYPSNATAYILRVYGNGNNSDSQSIRVSVNSNNNYNQTTSVPIYNTNVVTTVATNVSQTGAQLNGLITNSNYANSNTHFEYGTTVNLGSLTVSRSTSGNVSFSEFVTNLNPKTIYFFQAVSEGPNGISRGAIEVFQTLKPIIISTSNPTSNKKANTTTGSAVSTTNTTNPSNNQTEKQPITQGTTMTSSESPIMLKIENHYQAIGKGDIVDYTVSYKNISTSKLTKPMIQVYVPKGITATNTSSGTYSEDDRTLSAPIEDLEPNTEGTIYLQARVDSIDPNLAQIVTTTILVYTNPNGAQENAMAYVLNKPKAGNALGASAVSAVSSISGKILGIGLIGWLIIIVILLLLILIARSLFGRRKIVND